MLTLDPRISEQTYAMAAQRVYVFNVETSVSKQEIAEAVERQFEVTVTAVNTSNLKGKKKASNRRNQRSVYGSRKDIKKAYVTLKEGDEIKIFKEIN